MVVQQIDSHNLLIYLSGDELRLTPQELKTAEAADILSAALGDTDREEWQNVYLELYVGQNCLLLFARAHSGVPRFFMFDGIEPLIAAANVCPPDIISFLTLLNDEYCLVVYPWSYDALPTVLLEYGEELELHVNHAQNYALHLTEHGKVLLGPSALFDLQSLF